MGLPHERSVQSSVMGVGGPSPQDFPDEVMRREGPVPELVLLTLNINSWAPFQGQVECRGLPSGNAISYSAAIAGAQAHLGRAL